MFARAFRQSIRQTARVSRLNIARGVKTQASHQKSNQIGIIAAAVGTIAVIGYSAFESTAATHKKVVALGEIKKQQELEQKRADEEAEKKRIAEKEARETKAIEKARLAEKATAATAAADAAGESKSSETTSTEAGETKTVKPAGGKDTTNEDGDHKEAYDPDTGEINWDCPCLGGMADGPCGEEFKAAFSCFVYSKEEPKGIECIDKFKNMQDCFRRYPDVYAEELRDDDDYGEVPATEESGKPNEVKGDSVDDSDSTISDKAAAVADTIKETVKEKTEEVKEKVDNQVDETKEKTEAMKEEIKDSVKTDAGAIKAAAEDKLNETDARLQAAKDYLKAQTEEQGKILQAKAENDKKFVEAAIEAKAAQTKEDIEKSRQAVVSEAARVAERVKSDPEEKDADSIITGDTISNTTGKTTGNKSGN